MTIDIKEIKKSLRNAMMAVGLQGTFVKVLEGPKNIIVYVDPDDSPSVFQKKAKDLAFRLKKDKINILVDNAQKLIGISIPKYTAAFYGNLADVKLEGLKIPIGVSQTLSETKKVKRKISETEEVEFNANEPIIHDFEKYPHLIIAGSTGSGKSRMLHSILYNLITANPNSINIIPIDFKGTELRLYEKFMPSDFTHVEEVEEVSNLLEKLVAIMETRYKECFKDKYTNIDEYNKDKDNAIKLNRIFLVIDEYADMILASKKLGTFISTTLVRLAQKGRAAGIHLIISTQRPTVDILSGHLKANIEAKIALKVSTAIDSRIVLDEEGAEDLIPGEFIYKVGTCIPGNCFFIDLNPIKENLFGIKVEQKPANNNTNNTNNKVKTKPYPGVFPTEDLVRYTSARVPGFPKYTWMDVVWGEIKRHKEMTLFDLISKLSYQLGLPFERIQFKIRLCINLLEVYKKVKSEQDIKNDSFYVTEFYCKNWKIINLVWEKERSSTEYVSIEDQLFPNKTSKSNLWTIQEEKEISTMLKKIPLGKRIDLIKNAIANLKNPMKGGEKYE